MKAERARSTGEPPGNVLEPGGWGIRGGWGPPGPLHSPRGAGRGVPGPYPHPPFKSPRAAMLVAGSPYPPAGLEEYRGCGARRGGEVRARLGARLPGVGAPGLHHPRPRLRPPRWDGALPPCVLPPPPPPGGYPPLGRLQGGDKQGHVGPGGHAKITLWFTCSEPNNKGAGAREQVGVLGAHPAVLGPHLGTGWSCPGKGTLGWLDGEVSGCPQPSRSRAGVLTARVGWGGVKGN